MAKRRLEIDIIVDERGSTRGFTRMGREVDTLESRMRRMGATGARVLGGAVVAGAVAAAYGIKKSVEEAREANKVGAQTGAVIKSTGGAAKVTEKQVASLAGAISLKAGMDDEAIQKGANLLLTFTNIRNEAGKGNAIFDQSTRTIVDMSVALDQDLKSSAIQVGKALNDPIKGLTALQRVGVSFSEQKAEQIKQWVEEGHVLRAQKAILRELNKEFGGSAAAQADSFDKLKVSFENAQESIGQVFLPILSDAADEITEHFMPRVERAGGAISRIFDRKDLGFEGKFKRAGKVIEREFGDIPPKIAGAIEDAVPIVASRAGRIGVAVAKGTIEGFVEADVWGKAAIAGILLAKFGGRGAFIAAGRGMGSAISLGMANTTVAGARPAGLRTGKAFGRAVGVGAIAGLILAAPTIRDAVDEYIGDPIKEALGDVFGDEIGDVFSGAADLIDPAGLGPVPKALGIDVKGFVKDQVEELQGLVLEVPPPKTARAERRLREYTRMVGREGGRARDGFRKHIDLLPDIAERSGRGINRNMLPQLDRLKNQGGRKSDAFAGRVAGSFGSLDAAIYEALGNIGGNVDEMLGKLDSGESVQFNLKALEQQLPQLKPGQVPDIKARGGAITRPMAIVGEEAPQHHEWVIATNPAYRRDNVGYWMQAGHDLGVPGFAKGGAFAEPRITGPDPLRSGAQAGVHKAFEAAQAYIRSHQPKPGTGGVAGYVGPPPSFKQLGDNEWVDSHTMQVAQWLSSKFGVPITDGWRPENAGYGAPNSSHKRGTPSNPGAFDFGTSYPLLAFAKKRIAGLTEAMIHDYGFGLHTHLAFFAKGGLINGKVSWFNGPASTTASGTPVSQPGLALNLAPGTGEAGWNNATTQGWMDAARAGDPVYGRTKIAGHVANLPIIDLGPHESTGRAIDVTAAGVHKLGIPLGSFPTDSIGTVEILGGGKSAGQARKKQGPRARPGRTGKSGGTEGPAGKRRKGENDPRQIISLPGMAASEVPKGLENLSPGITSLFTSPGMSREQRFSASELGLQIAGLTEDTKDDEALYSWQMGVSQRRKQAIQKEINRLSKRLQERMTNKQREKIISRLNGLREELGTTQGRITSAREGLAGLGELGESGEDPALKVAEEAKQVEEETKQAIEEQTAVMKGLKEELERNRKVSESEMAVGLVEARRALADLISGELGPRIDHRSHTAGVGTVGSST